MSNLWPGGQKALQCTFLFCQSPLLVHVVLCSVGLDCGSNGRATQGIHKMQDAIIATAASGVMDIVRGGIQNVVSAVSLARGQHGGGKPQVARDGMRISDHGTQGNGKAIAEHKFGRTGSVLDNVV